MKFYQDLNVQCPFYRQERPAVLLCEGVEDGAGLQMTFDTPSHKRDYKDDFCCEFWKGCRLAGMLNDKWENGSVIKQ